LDFHPDRFANVGEPAVAPLETSTPTGFQQACSECDGEGCAKCDPIGEIRRICSGERQVQDGEDAEDALKQIADIIDASPELKSGTTASPKEEPFWNPETGYLEDVTHGGQLTAQTSTPAPARDWADIWAQDFHDTYERTAPQFGYETRPESAKPWADVPENNRKLMTAVCAEVLCRFLKSRESGVTATPVETASRLNEAASRLVAELRATGLSSDWQVSKWWREKAIELESQLTQVRSELEKAKSSRLHTQDWYARHYGKLEDWARKRLPDPWRTEFFNCVANGTWGFDDIGEPYMSQVGRIVPGGYFRMDTAAKQLLQDQYMRAESAELDLAADVRDWAKLAEELGCEPTREAMSKSAKELTQVREELAKRDKCSYMGPMRDCPTHGESKDLNQARIELGQERLAHEKIADLLLPLVGTPDGTSVGAASKAVAEITRLRSELERARELSKRQIERFEEAELRRGKAEAENKRLKDALVSVSIWLRGNLTIAANAPTNSEPGRAAIIEIAKMQLAEVEAALHSSTSTQEENENG